MSEKEKAVERLREALGASVANLQFWDDARYWPDADARADLDGARDSYRQDVAVLKSRVIEARALLGSHGALLAAAQAVCDRRPALDPRRFREEPTHKEESMTTIAPALAQREEALAEANRIRWAMGRYRKQIRELGFFAGASFAGASFAATLLEDPDDIVARMKVGYLLRSVHRIGHKRAERIAALADTTLSRKVGPLKPKPYEKAPLTLRQRAIIVRHLRGLAGEDDPE